MQEHVAWSKGKKRRKAQISTRLCADYDIVLTMSKDPVFKFSRPSYPPIYHQLKTPVCGTYLSKGTITTANPAHSWVTAGRISKTKANSPDLLSPKELYFEIEKAFLSLYTFYFQFCFVFVLKEPLLCWTLPEVSLTEQALGTLLHALWHKWALSCPWHNRALIFLCNLSKSTNKWNNPHSSTCGAHRLWEFWFFR